MIRPACRGARRAAVVLAAIACACGLWWSFRGGWPTLASHLRDDAFYEFAWADNLAKGRGPVVGAGAPTSGVQYLWCLLLALCSAVGIGPLPQVAVVLGISCHALGAATWLLFARGAAAVIAALLWLGNPLLLRECQNGQETALACLLLALLWHVRRRGEGTFALFAVLTVLARTDLWLVVLPLSLAQHLRSGGARSRWWRGLATPTLAAAVHVAANLWASGHWLQDSGLPMAWLFHANFALLEPTFGEWLARQWFFLRPVLLGGPFGLVSVGGLALAVALTVRPFLRPTLLGVPLLLVTAGLLAGASDFGVAVVAAAFLAVLPRRSRRVPLAFIALAAGLGLVLVMHWALRWYPRDYYAAPLFVLAAAAIIRARHMPLPLLAVVAFGLLRTTCVDPEPLAGQRAMELCGRHAHAFVPPGTVLGSFNSGIATWYAERGEGAVAVQNLDGVVDRRALHALQQRRLTAWLDERGIRFVADNPVQFALDPRLPHACGPWFGPGFDPAQDLVEVARFCVAAAPNARGTNASEADTVGAAARAGTDSFRLYWRRGRGAPPPPFASFSARELAPLDDGSRVVLWPADAGATLRVLARDGARTPLATVDAPTCVVLAIPPALVGTGRLFADDAREPVLVLR